MSTIEKKGKGFSCYRSLCLILVLFVISLFSFGPANILSADIGSKSKTASELKEKISNNKIVVAQAGQANKIDRDEEDVTEGDEEVVKDEKADKTKGKETQETQPAESKSLKVISQPTKAVGREIKEEKIGEISIIVDENVDYRPAPLEKNKVLEDRGDLEAQDLVGEDEEYRSLIEIKSKIDPNNPIFLDTEGNLAGTGDPNIKLASNTARVGVGPHPKALEAEGITYDEFGLVNWADAIRKGVISPLAGLTPEKKAAENYEEYVIVFQSKSDYMADVIFPHDIHSYWLDCSNCHRKIFIDKAGANPVTMKKVVAGYYCGRCHGKVAFPLEECTRCHIKPKGGGAIVSYPLFEKSGVLK